MKRSDLAEDLAEIIATLDPFLSTSQVMRLRQKDERKAEHRRFEERKAGLDLYPDSPDWAIYHARLDAERAEQAKDTQRRRRQKSGHPDNVVYLHP
ncbi:MAG: hypothetical protein ACREFM_17610 [Hypericibacter sp.]